MEFQDELDNNKIVVSFGSLCTSYFTGYEKLSHIGMYHYVLRHLRLLQFVCRGILRYPHVLHF